MSCKQDVTKPHKCIFSKCKGTLRDPVASYGYWAYWRTTGAGGWYATP